MVDFNFDNPWNSFNKARGTINDIYADRARKRAGEAYASGDTDSAGAILARNGDLSGAEQMRTSGRREADYARAEADRGTARRGATALAEGRYDDAASAEGELGKVDGVKSVRDQQDHQAAQRLKLLQGAAPALRRAYAKGGKDAAVAQLRAFGPQALRTGVTEADFATMVQGMDTDPEATLGAIEEGAKRNYKIITTNKGMKVVDLDLAENGDDLGMPKAPANWDYDDDGNLVPRKGGAYDPEAVAARAGAGAAARRAAAPPKWVSDPSPRGGGRGRDPNSPNAIRGGIMRKIADGEPLTPGERVLWNRSRGGVEADSRVPDAPPPQAAPAPRAAATPAPRVSAVGTQDRPATPRSRQEAAALPAGSWIRDPRGNVFQKR